MIMGNMKGHLKQFLIRQRMGLKFSGVLHCTCMHSTM